MAILKRADVVQYEDIPIRVDREGQERVKVRADFAGFGSWDGTFALAMRRSDIDQALAGASRASETWVKRSASLDSLDPLREMGRELFSGLFGGRRESLYQRTLDRAQAEGHGVRLSLDVADPDLDALPWEFLHDGQSFVNLSPWSPVVRAPASSGAAEARPALERLRVLFIGADVTGHLGVDEEIDRVTAIGNEFGQIELRVVRDVARGEFGELVRNEDFDVLHFAGTGLQLEYGQALVLTGREGRRLDPDRGVSRGQLVYGKELVGALSAKETPALVYFGACNTESLAKDTIVASQASVGMRGDITADACMAFMEGMYRAIVALQPLGVAVTRGRQEIDAENPGTREWGLPVFYTRSSGSLLLARPAEAVEEPGLESLGPQTSPTHPMDAARQPEWDGIQLRLEVQERNLRALNRQVGGKGQDPPPYIRSQIAKVREQIERLRGELDALSRADES